MQYRRSDYDVTNTVQVSSVPAVKRAVEELYSQTWPSGKVERLETAFSDFERLFNGHFPGYLGCDTVYHDLQHSLDDTLAMARLLAGYDRSHAVEQRLGAERAVLPGAGHSVQRLGEPFNDLLTAFVEQAER